MITKIKKLATEHPEQVEIIAENKDGSIYAHIPTAWVKINPKREISEEEKENMRIRIKSVRRMKN